MTVKYICLKSTVWVLKSYNKYFYIYKCPREVVWQLTTFVLIYLSRLSAGPSPKSVIGSPRARKQALTSASSVDTVICLALLRLSNSSSTSDCLSLIRSSSSITSPMGQCTHYFSRHTCFSGVHEITGNHSLRCYWTWGQIMVRLRGLGQLLRLIYVQLTTRDVDVASIDSSFDPIFSWPSAPFPAQTFPLLLLQTSIEDARLLHHGGVLVVRHLYSYYQRYMNRPGAYWTRVKVWLGYMYIQTRWFPFENLGCLCDRGPICCSARTNPNAQ